MFLITASYKNPTLVDVPGATIPNPHGGKLHIREVIWQNPTTAGHTLTITINGKDITRKCPANNAYVNVFKFPPGKVDSFVVKTIQSGTLEIWFDE